MNITVAETHGDHSWVGLSAVSRDIKYCTFVEQRRCADVMEEELWKGITN
jgi:hypothetical protein